MISLKKLIESNQKEWAEAALAAYCAALEAMGNSGVRACPPLGMQLQLGLSALQRQLSDNSTVSGVRETQQRVESELGQWGERSAEYYKGKTEEFKEIMMIMARTAETVGDRDQRYSAQLTEFTSKLHSLASMDDLGRIRDSLVLRARELQDRVDQMARDGQQMLAQMRGELRHYQARLEEAERLASLDPLTGLKNRRRMERAVAERMGREQPFSVVLLDLNGFKQVNDSYGHAAGDDVLKQFATELRSAFRAADDVGRWGGDEFVVLLDCGPEDVGRHLERVRQWVFGDYVVQDQGVPHRLPIIASVGTAVWQGGESMAELFARADRDMYQEKNAVRQREAKPA
uniref:diguanylate cyclase n=1 Tax=Solibacter usitatus (strain Ellin6076) TaxID=234267 RepID=Q01XM9_SOLUE